MGLGGLGILKFEAAWAWAGGYSKLLPMHISSIHQLLSRTILLPQIGRQIINNLLWHMQTMQSLSFGLFTANSMRSNF